MFSNRDLTREYEKPGFDVESHEAVFRRARARESILAGACYFNEVGATTHVLKDEVLAQLEKMAPPEIDSAETYHTTQVIHFVNDYVLPQWSSHMQMIVMRTARRRRATPQMPPSLTGAKGAGAPRGDQRGLHEDRLQRRWHRRACSPRGGQGSTRAGSTRARTTRPSRLRRS